MNRILKVYSHKQTIRKVKVYLNFGNTVNIVINPPTVFQTVFENTKKTMKRTKFCFSIEIIWKSSNQYSEGYQNQIHLVEQPSSRPVNYYSGIRLDSSNLSNSRNRYSPYQSSRIRSPSLSLSCENSRFWYRCRNREFNSNRILSRSR